MTPAQVIATSPRATLACERVRSVIRGGVPPSEHFDGDYVILDPVMGPWPGAAEDEAFVREMIERMTSHLVAVGIAAAGS